MKTKKIAILIVAALFLFSNTYVFSAEKQIKHSCVIVDNTNKIITTRNVTINPNSITYKNQKGGSVDLDLDDIRSIYVSEGNYFWLSILIFSASVGSIAATISDYSSIAVLAGGLVVGAVGGGIIGHNWNKPFELIYYRGRWLDFFGENEYIP